MGKEFYFKSDDLVIWRPTGTLDVPKIVEFLKFLDQSAVNKDQHFHRFIDLTKVDGISVSYTSLSNIAAQRTTYATRTLSRSVRMAFLISNSFTFGMARMYESILADDHYDIAIFRTIEEVAQWLGVDEEMLTG
jgi:hypothetical protein